MQVAIYTLYAVVSLMLLYFTAKLFFGYQFRGDLFRFLGGYLLVLVSMFSIGMLVGGVSPDTKIASVIACILYFPMLILSGATLPYEVMPSTLKRVADVMPLTQGIKLLKAASLGHPADSVLAQICIMGVVAVACTVIAVKYFKWE